MCFNSLQTGKRIQSKTLPVGRLSPSTWSFNSPSNGKAYPKERKDLLERQERMEFQFPSNGKAYPKIYDTVIVGIR